MATLRKKEDRYFVDYRVNGHRVRKAIGKSKRIAELALKDIELKIERQEIGFVEKDSELNKLFEEFTAHSAIRYAQSYQRKRQGCDILSRLMHTGLSIEK